MLTCTLEADWIQLPVENYFAMFPTLKQGVVAEVFKIKGASPWAITRAENLQVSLFLPNRQPMDDWYAAIYALPTVWPDKPTMGANNMRKVVGHDFHYMRKKYRVPGMWGTVRPRWPLLKQHLEATGPGWYSVEEQEERLFTHRSNQPGDDMKDEVRTDDNRHAWRLWSTAWDRFLRLRQPGPPLKFPSEEGILSYIYDQVRHEEHVIAVQFLGSQQDVTSGTMHQVD